MMMSPTGALPGLERLMEICRRSGVPMRQEPPAPSALIAGQLVAGLPVDPLLAAAHSHVSYIGVEEGFFLLRAGATQESGVTRVNERWRHDWAEPFGPLFVFGKEDVLSYYYATVPRLADARGWQPVVRLDMHEEPHALPLASNIDNFFDTYSRYIEALVEEPEYEELGPAALAFPWQVPEILARDLPLVQMLRDARFDFLMAGDDETREWVSQVVAASLRR